MYNAGMTDKNKSIDESIADFDLDKYMDKDAPKVKPRIHKAGEDSTCISCEG